MDRHVPLPPSVEVVLVEHGKRQSLGASRGRVFDETVRISGHGEIGTLNPSICADEICIKVVKR